MGVDPELRTRIWAHLRTLGASGVAVLLTTHYIEEARQVCVRISIFVCVCVCVCVYSCPIHMCVVVCAIQADRVGLMRGGQLLAEGRPLDLMRKFRQASLEVHILNVLS